MAAVQTETLVDRAAAVLSARRLADADTPAMLMVSGGSDSTALAYIACELRERGALGQLAMLHVNHRLRGEDADEDARFVAQLAERRSARARTWRRWPGASVTWRPTKRSKASACMRRHRLPMDAS